MKKLILCSSVALAAFLANADYTSLVDRPGGFKVGERMTISPYVCFSYTYDSNVDSSDHSDGGSSLCINPGFTLNYKADKFNLSFGAYYQYHCYLSGYSKELNQGSWGQNLSINWTNTKDGGRGWTFTLMENLSFISQDDDMTNDGGRGIGRDRLQLTVGAALSRNITDKWHASANVDFYYLWYDNDSSSYAEMYGWSRWSAGLSTGYAFTPWTDIYVSGNYAGYTQENDDVRNIGMSGRRQNDDYSGYSDSWSVHLGISTRATKKISYNLSGGVTGFNYAGAVKTSGFTYSASASWMITETWSTHLLASSYFHPSEYDSGAYTRSDNLSWGISHSMIRGKLTANFDIAYRHENNESAEYADSEYKDDILTARLGLNYSFNRFVSVYGRVEYQFALFGDAAPDDWDYDRWRATLGLRLAY